MIKNFENKYGKPNKTILVVGDYDKGDNNMKGKEPTICKKFRRIFRNAGYKTYLVNEFRTSKLCNCSNCKNIKDNLGSAKIYKCDKCNMILDRDINASINIYKNRILLR
jgi:transposase